MQESKITPPLISIIIAFYNEQLYLDRCLQSLVDQKYKLAEIILINDGSTDNSLQIATTYLDLFHKVNLISIENSGLSEARNVGLQNTTGTYVTFLDADDTLMPNMMQLFADKVKETNVDLIISDFQLVSEDRKIELPTKWSPNFKNISNTEQFIALFYKERIIETVWGKLFSTKIAKQIPFKKGLWFEDRPFFIEFVLTSKTVTFIPEKLVRIYCRESSITRRVLSKKRLHDCHQIFQEELKILKKYHVDTLYNKGAFKTALGYLVDNYLIQIIDKEKITDYKEVCNTYLSFLSDYKKNCKTKKIKLPFKSNIVFRLLTLPNYIGWKLSNALFKRVKKKRYKGIKKLKNL